MSQRFYGQFDNPQTDEAAWSYFPEGYKGHAIGVGECDGRFYSNTLAFEEAGWICLCIEPNPEWWNDLKMNRKHCQNYAISDSNGDAVLSVYDIKSGDHSALTGIDTDKRLVGQYSGTVVREVKVQKRTLDTAIAEAGIFPKIDYVSIDTEGNELDVLRGFDIKRWQPPLIIVENNYDDREILDYMMDMHRYVRSERVGVNDFYERY